MLSSERKLRDISSFLLHTENSVIHKFLIVFHSNMYKII